MKIPIRLSGIIAACLVVVRCGGASDAGNGGVAAGHRRDSLSVRPGDTNRVALRAADPDANLPDQNLAEALSPAMRRALLTSIPSLRLYGRNQFAPDVVRDSRTDGLLGLSLVVADFNGDGFKDAALLGYDRQSSYFVAVVSKADSSYQLIPLLAASELTPQDTVNRRIHIQRQPRGRVNLYGGANGQSTILLRADGVVHIVGEEGATLHYWDGTKFVTVDYGD